VMLILGRRLWLSFRVRSRLAVQGDASSANPVDGLFEAAPIGYLEIDPKGMIRRVNRKECEMRGSTRRELIGKACWTLLPPAERQRYRDRSSAECPAMWPCCPTSESISGRMAAPSPWKCTSNCCGNHASRVVGMRLAAIDMTEGKKSEDEAYEAASELRALFQTFPDLFIRLNRSGQVIESTGGQSSDQFLSPDRFRGKNLRDLLPAGVMDQLHEAQEKTRKTKAPQIVEFSVDGRAGTQIYETRVMPLDWEHSIATLRNITARKKRREAAAGIRPGTGAQERRTRVGTGDGARSYAAQEPLSGQHEPRDPHAHEWCVGDDRLFAGNQPHRRATGSLPDPSRNRRTRCSP